MNSRVRTTRALLSFRYDCRERPEVHQGVVRWVQWKREQLGADAAESVTVRTSAHVTATGARRTRDADGRAVRAPVMTPKHSAGDQSALVDACEELRALVERIEAPGWRVEGVEYAVGALSVSYWGVRTIGTTQTGAARWSAPHEEIATAAYECAHRIAAIASTRGRLVDVASVDT